MRGALKARKITVIVVGAAGISEILTHLGFCDNHKRIYRESENGLTIPSLASPSGSAFD